MNTLEMSVVADNKSSNQFESNEADNRIHRSLPHMQFFDRIMQVPVVDSAVRKSQNVYGKIKLINPVVSTTLDAAENMTRRIAVPLAHKLERPLYALDHTLMASLDRLETTIPVVRDTPSGIIRRTEQAISTLKNISMKKTNDALATTGGVRALDTLDAASNRAISLLDHFLPAYENDKEKLQIDFGENEEPQVGINRAARAVGKVGRTVTDRLQGKAQRVLPVAICNLGLAESLESLNSKVQELKKQDVKKSGEETPDPAQ